MRELAQYALSPFQGLGFVTLVSRGSASLHRLPVVWSPLRGFNVQSFNFQILIFHLSSFIFNLSSFHPPHPRPTPRQRGGESLLTAVSPYATALPLPESKPRSHEQRLPGFQFGVWSLELLNPEGGDRPQAGGEVRSTEPLSEVWSLEHS